MNEAGGIVMRADASQWRPLAVTIGIRPRTYRRLIRAAGATVVLGAVVIGSGAFGVPPLGPEVRLAAEGDREPAFTVGLNVSDGTPPFDPREGPERDTSPTKGLVPESYSTAYGVDIGVGDRALRDVEFTLAVPRGFALSSLPEYCGGGSGLFETGSGEVVLRCRIGDLEPRRYFTGSVAMTAGVHSGASKSSISVQVTVDGGAHRMQSGEVAVRGTSPAAGECDPFGIPAPVTAPENLPRLQAPVGGNSDVRPSEVDDAKDAARQKDSLSATGRVSGLVTDGAAEVVSLEGADRCGHEITRTVTPFEGHFSFLGLVPGTYRLTVDGRAPVMVDLTAESMVVDGLTF